MPSLLKRISVFHGRPVYLVGEPLPLLGHIAFGVIDRGTNILQVRPSTLCPHNCIYCSVDAGPHSRYRVAEYLVDHDYLAEWTTMIAKEVKGEPVEALIDGVGEPLTHPRILALINRLSSSKHVWRTAIETHGGFLSKNLIKKLDEAGLSRINLSIDTLDPEKARFLAGVKWYDVNRIISLIEYTIEETRIDVVLTPVVVPGINEDDMRDLIKLARRLGLGEKSGWPTGVLIQKYEKHKYGRRPRGVREWSWSEFYKWLRRLQEETGYKLIPTMEELGYHRAPRVPVPYRPGDRVLVRPVGPGWHRGEILAVDEKNDRILSLFCSDCPLGRRVRVRIVRSKDNIIVAKR